MKKKDVKKKKRKRIKGEVPKAGRTTTKAGKARSEEKEKKNCRRRKKHY